MNTQYLTAIEAAAAIGVVPSRIRQLARKGKLPQSKRFGKSWMIHPHDLKVFRKSSKLGRPRGSFKEKNSEENVENHLLFPEKGNTIKE